MKLAILTIISLSCFIQVSCAQDKIYKKNGKEIFCKIIEIGTSEIKYKLPKETEGPIYVLDKESIIKIVLENGTVQKFIPDLRNPEQYSGQLHKAIKVDFLGPLLGYTQITFERSTGVGKGYEVGIAIIGAGKNQDINYYYNSNSLQVTKRNQFGLAGSFGYKFSKLPDFIFGRTRFTHLMQGSYAKPIIYLGNFSENKIIDKGISPVPVSERQNITFASFQIELGKQWVLGEKFVIDTYTGFGYGFDNQKNNSFYNDNTSAFNYINVRAGRSPGLSLTYGVKIGLLIK